MSFPVTVVLVRHAWAGVRTEGADDGARPLDEDGRRQADRLLDHLDVLLDDHGLVTVSASGPAVTLVSSPFVRCVETLAPAARRLGRPVGTDPRLVEAVVPLASSDGWPDAAYLGARALGGVDAAVAGTAPEGVLVVCAHGEVLPALVAAMAGRDDVDVPSAVDLTAKRLPKGAAWLLPAGDRDLVELPPVPTEP